MANTTGKKFGGRQKGTPNKTSAIVKEAIAQALVKSAPELVRWLNQIAKTDLYKAVKAYEGLAEFAIPKLQRQVDENGDDVKTVEFVVRQFNEPSGPKKTN